MNEPLASINVPVWDGTAKEAGQVWCLAKGGHTAACHLFSHPKGGEVRLTVDGEWRRGSTAIDGRTLLDIAFEWKTQFRSKGWG